MPESIQAMMDYRDLKARVHAQILEDIDLESLDRLKEQVARARVSEAIRDVLQRDRTPLALPERERMVREIADELFGLGPIEPLLADSSISDILINGPDKIYIERAGVLERTDLFFNDTQHLMRIIERLSRARGQKD